MNINDKTMTAKVENHKNTPLVMDKVEDIASHAWEYFCKSTNIVAAYPIIGTKTDNTRYMPIIGHLRCAL